MVMLFTELGKRRGSNLGSSCREEILSSVLDTSGCEMTLIHPSGEVRYTAEHINLYLGITFLTRITKLSMSASYMKFSIFGS